MKIEFDDGYSFGKGAFETIKVVDGRPLFLKEHIERLEKSLKFFGINRKIECDKIYDYLSKSEGKNFALKIIVSDENFILTSREDHYKNNYKKFKLKISDAKRNSTSKIIYHKSLCYYENILEHKLANESGYDSSLFFNEKNEVAETSFANIFFVKENKIYTPPISSGILKGTMRDFLLETYEIKEKAINFGELSDFEECFISNSLMGVRNVSLINCEKEKIKFSGEDNTKLIQDNLKKFGF